MPNNLRLILLVFQFMLK